MPNIDVLTAIVEKYGLGRIIINLNFRFIEKFIR